MGGGGNREGFKEIMTFQLSSENFRIKKFRGGERRTVQENKVGKGTEVRKCLMHVR